MPASASVVSPISSTPSSAFPAASPSPVRHRSLSEITERLVIFVPRILTNCLLVENALNSQGGFGVRLTSLLNHKSPIQNHRSQIASAVFLVLSALLLLFLALSAFFSFFQRFKKPSTPKPCHSAPSIVIHAYPPPRAGRNPASLLLLLSA